VTIEHLPYDRYCDSFWDLSEHVDEDSSACQNWICPKEFYQCRTGQCIPVEWVCDGEWDCSDASDEEAIVLIKKWSNHNINLTHLHTRLRICTDRYRRTSFSDMCNTSFEFGCYRSEVSNPLDIYSYHPCINLSQIGDGVKDCYNAYDEKNTLKAQSTIGGMWGFHAECGIGHRTYSDACIREKESNCSDILCSECRDKDGSCSGEKDFICLKDNQCMKNKRCDGRFDCEHGEDEYWCATGSFVNHNQYRYDKKSHAALGVFLVSLRSYPSARMLQSNQANPIKSIQSHRDGEPFIVHSYQCNRGVAVMKLNQTKCLCPPAYYGRWCEFFNDRITIIAHLDQTTLPNTTGNVTLKIKVSLLFNHQILDDHYFIIVPTIERLKKIKHRFYLLYSRSTDMLMHKRKRYFNRTDIIHNHPYSVHFDLFKLEKNKNVEEVGSWHYPIYFDYLPSHRLAAVLRFPSSFANQTLHPCSQHHCNQNSTCLPILNQNGSYYCACKSGYYGQHCELYELHCETYCPSNALCRSNDHDRLLHHMNPYCICPLDHFGPQCNLKYDGCDSELCLNGGSCHLTYDPSGETPAICICSRGFYGKRCENSPAQVHLRFNITGIFSVRAAVIQFYAIRNSFSELSIEHQQVYHDLPSNMTYHHPETNAPPIGLLKIYDHSYTPRYFVIYSLNRSLINITVAPRYCPFATSYLSQGWFPKSARNNPTISSIFFF
jgi:hypothetical protein